VERRIYPRQVPSHVEDTCFSMDGTHLWRMDNWKKGWAIVDRVNQKASFIFSSNSDELFHRIDLIDRKGWDCFDCLLRIFMGKELHAPTSIPLPALRLSKGRGFDSLHGIMGAIGKLIESEGIVKCTIPVSGGLVIRKHKLKKMKIRSGCLSLDTEQSRLLIDSSRVGHVDVSRKANSFLGTFYNVSGLPQLILEAI